MKDLESGMMLLGLLDTVSSGYYPSDTDDEDNGPLRFDSENPKLTAAMTEAEKYLGLLLWTLYHHQGGSSDIGQPIRRALGMGQYDRMTDEQISDGKAAADFYHSTGTWR